jgi:hypothetical protein
MQFSLPAAALLNSWRWEYDPLNTRKLMKEALVLFSVN